MTMPGAAVGGSAHSRGMLFAAVAGVGGVLVAAFAGWLGFLVFFAGYLATWIVSIGYQRGGGVPTRKQLPSLLGLIAVVIVVAFVASEFGWFLRQASAAGIGGNLIAYFWTIFTDPSRWADYLWWRAGLFVLFSAFGAAGLVRAMTALDPQAAARQELARYQRGDYRAPTGSAWGPPAAAGTQAAASAQPGGSAPGAPGAGTFGTPGQGYGRQGYGRPSDGDAGQQPPASSYGHQPPASGYGQPASSPAYGEQPPAQSDGEQPAAQGYGTATFGASDAAAPSQSTTNPTAPTTDPASGGGFFDPSEGEGLGTPPEHGPGFTFEPDTDQRG